METKLYKTTVIGNITRDCLERITKLQDIISAEGCEDSNSYIRTADECEFCMKADPDSYNVFMRKLRYWYPSLEIRFDDQIRSYSQKEKKLYRYLVVEYCFEDSSTSGTKNILGSYRTAREAKAASGHYIKRNVKRMREKYRDWVVHVQKERVYFDIKGF